MYLMKDLAQQAIFPYGLMTREEFAGEAFWEDSRVKRYIDRSCSLFGDIKFFPKKNPLFAELLPFKNSFPMTLPEWWYSAIDYTPYPFKWVLPSVTVEEFYSGTIDPARWKLFRTMLPQDMQKLAGQSPALGKIFNPEHPYRNNFLNRGKISTEGYTLEITVNPSDLFWLSNGNGWDSCQHHAKSSDYNRCVVGSIFDPQTAMAYILTPGKKLGEEESLEVRAMLRMLNVPGTNIPIVFIDKIYGNNTALQKALHETIVEHCLTQNILVGTGNRGYLKSGEGTQSNYITSKAISKYHYGEWSYMDNLGVGYANTVTWNENTYDVSSYSGATYIVKPRNIEEGEK